MAPLPQIIPMVLNAVSLQSSASNNNFCVSESLDSPSVLRRWCLSYIFSQGTQGSVDKSSFGESAGRNSSRSERAASICEEILCLLLFGDGTDSDSSRRPILSDGWKNVQNRSRVFMKDSLPACEGKVCAPQAMSTRQWWSERTMVTVNVGMYRRRLEAEQKLY